jgi:hypothetical protein
MPTRFAITVLVGSHKGHNVNTAFHPEMFFFKTCPPGFCVLLTTETDKEKEKKNRTTVFIMAVRTKLESLQARVLAAQGIKSEEEKILTIMR